MGWSCNKQILYRKIERALSMLLILDQRHKKCMGCRHRILWRPVHHCVNIQKGRCHHGNIDRTDKGPTEWNIIKYWGNRKGSTNNTSQHIQWRSHKNNLHRSNTKQSNHQPPHHTIEGDNNENDNDYCKHKETPTAPKTQATKHAPTPTIKAPTLQLTLCTHIVPRILLHLAKRHPISHVSSPKTNIPLQKSTPDWQTIPKPKQPHGLSCSNGL